MSPMYRPPVSLSVPMESQSNPQSLRRSKPPSHPPPPPPSILKMSEVSFDPNASMSTLNSAIDERVKVKAVSPVVPPRPKHLSKRYMSRLLTFSPTESSAMSRSESLPSFVNLVEETAPEEISKSKLLQSRKVVPLLVEPEENSMSTSFSRELRKVKSTICHSRNSPLILKRKQDNNDGDAEEFKHEISIEIVDSDSIDSKRSSYSDTLMRSSSLFNSKREKRNSKVLIRRNSAPEFKSSQSFKFFHHNLSSSSTNANTNIKIVTTDEHSDRVAVFVTSYSSDEDDALSVSNGVKTVENTKINKNPPTSKSLNKFARKLNSIKRKTSGNLSDGNKTFLAVNSMLNLTKTSDSEILYNLASRKKLNIQAPNSPRPPRRNLELETAREKDAVTRLRRAALVVQTAGTVSSFMVQEKRCHKCRGKQERNATQRSQERQFDADGNLTSLGRCWHRLYVSKARLNTTSTTSELFAAFAMVALVEMQINSPCTVPDVCWILFSMNTTMLVGVNILALMISTFILPNINAVIRLHPSALIAESAHDTMRGFIEVAWGFSTFLNLLLSLANIALISWVKFWDLGVLGAITSTAIVAPSMLVFVLVALHFYRKLEATDLGNNHNTPGPHAANQRHGFDNPAFVPETAATNNNQGHDNPTFVTESTTNHRTHGQVTTNHHQGFDNPAFVQSENDADTVQVRCDVDNNADGSLTPRGLQWRSLHVSLAKLEATSSASELMSGFATMATVELQTNSPTEIPSWMFVLLAINSTVLVLLNVFALMISTFILPSVEAITHQRGSNLVHSSPHHALRWYIELAWVASTVLGMFVFLFEVIILSWTKFWDFSFDGAAASTGIILMSMAVFVGFTAYFYYTLVDHKCETTDLDMRQLDDLKSRLDVEFSRSESSKLARLHLDENFTGERLV